MHRQGGPPLLCLLLSLNASAATLSLDLPSPVLVDLPGVHVLGVGHREAPADEEHPEIADEAELSAEEPGLDEALAAESVERLAERLAASRRFDVLELGALPTPARRGWLARPLLPADVGSLCAANEVDALVLLDGLDHGLLPEDGDRVQVRTGWRVYRCEGGVSSFVELSEVDGADQVRDVALERAETLAGRMNPTFTTVERTWFPGGSARLKAAGELAKNDDWASAISAWSTLYDEGSDKERGRAAFDLAVAAERSGDVRLAHAWLELALPLLPEKHTAPYLAELVARGAAPRSTDEEAGPLALPGDGR